jgi:uncharacterized membrane protein HdeD (DUF308 family)
MLEAASKYWWVVLLRGILAILFGILLFVMPGLTVASLVIVFGAYALVDGLFAIFYSISGRNTDKEWGMHLIEGILGVAFGLLVLTWPELATIATGITLLVMIAVWAIVTGALQVISAIQLRKEIDNEIWLGLGGLISIVFGVILLRFPITGILAILWLIAGYSIAFGVLFIMLAFRLRNMRRPDTTTTTTSAPSRA